ncbi:hypothetical protein QYF61_006017, partial [Mycteria americana]
MWARRDIKIIENHKNKGFKGHQELTFQLNGQFQYMSIAPSYHLPSCTTFLDDISLVLSQYKRDMELLERVQQRAMKMFKGLGGKAERAGTVWPGEEKAWGDLTVMGQEAVGTKRNRTFPLNIRKHFHHEGDRALAQVALRGCGVSHLGDIQKPSGHSPGQPPL